MKKIEKEINAATKRIDSLVEKAYEKFGSDAVSNGVNYSEGKYSIFLKEDISTHYGHYYENDKYICDYAYDTKNKKIVLINRNTFGKNGVKKRFLNDVYRPEESDDYLLDSQLLNILNKVYEPDEADDYAGE